MRKADLSDKAKVIDILSKSFQNNMSVTNTIKDDSHTERRIAALMNYSFEVCFKTGEVFIGSDERSCALICYPERKLNFTDEVKLTFYLLIRCCGFQKLIRSGKRKALINKQYGNEPKLYLWFIGTLPEYQGRGFGSELLAQVIEKSRSQNRSIYLETSLASNLKWYQKFKFSHYASLDFGYELFLLKL